MTYSPGDIIPIISDAVVWKTILPDVASQTVLSMPRSGTHLALSPNIPTHVIILMTDFMVYDWKVKLSRFPVELAMIYMAE